MANFKKFKKLIEQQAQFLMSKPALFRVNVTKDDLWNTYINSFPEGTNPIFRTNTEHDCSCCKRFIRQMGNVVWIDENLVVRTLWDDFDAAEHPYNEVMGKLYDLVSGAFVIGPFVTKEEDFGEDKTRSIDPRGKFETFDHFYIRVGGAHLVRDGLQVNKKISDISATVDVFRGGLNLITIEAIDTVLELIAANALYRGDTVKKGVQFFRALKEQYVCLTDEVKKHLFAWSMPVTSEYRMGCRIKNSAIGQLLLDLSEGKDEEAAVKSYEKMVAPQNYKRPKGVVTPNTLKKLREKAEQLGIIPSFDRRFAVPSDVHINNCLYVDRSETIMSNIFDEAEKDITVSPQKLNNVIDIGMEDFLAHFPSCAKIELLVEPQHKGNFFSIIGPEHIDAPSMFSWENGYSWTYNGGYADSVKEKVKKAGGKIDGALRVSLAWYNVDDYDLHLVEEEGSHVYHGQRRSGFSQAKLDVDMNAGRRRSTEPVENITWEAEKNILVDKNHHIYVHNYSKRVDQDYGFEIEIECGNQLFTFAYGALLKHDESVKVADFHYTKDGKIVIDKAYIDMGEGVPVSTMIWNVPTYRFVKVPMIFLSPNYWDGNSSGNKHYMFQLEDCTNPDLPRGFFNEYLKPEFSEHRKVFEVLGAKCQVKKSDEQLSGVGFSSSLPASVIAQVTKVDGSKQLYRLSTV